MKVRVQERDPPSPPAATSAPPTEGQLLWVLVVGTVQGRDVLPQTGSAWSSMRLVLRGRPRDRKALLGVVYEDHTTFKVIFWGLSTIRLLSSD